MCLLFYKIKIDKKKILQTIANFIVMFDSREEDIFCQSLCDDSSTELLKGKRPRSSNFTSQEEDVLLSLVEKYSHKVENKKTNAVSWQDKKVAWEKIAAEFSSQCHSVRSSKNLKDKFENMKRKAKTTISSDRNELYKTGGGPHYSKASKNDERISSLLGKSASGLFNADDCDGQKHSETYLDVAYLDDENYISIELKDTSVDPVEKEHEKESSNWSKWNPAKLRKKTSDKLKFSKSVFADKNEEVLQKQATFFANEDRRGEERHILQVEELKLKSELLKLEINIKRLEIKKLS